MIQIVSGDLLTSDAPYICHQVNCQGAMGSGVAKQIRARWPVIYDEYKALCDRHQDNRLGLLGRVQCVRVGAHTAVLNVFGQLEYGRDHRRYTDMSALQTAFSYLSTHISPETPIAMPYRIGCGLAGGDWGEVMDMLINFFHSHLLTLYKKDS